MPAIRLEAEQQAIQSGGVAISDVFFGPVSKRFLVSAIMPVMRNGIAEYAVSIGYRSRDFPRYSKMRALGADRLAVVVDRSNTIVARSEKNEVVCRNEGSARIRGSHFVRNRRRC